METLMLVSNPTTRKGAKKVAKRKKARTAAQKAATRKMVAANKRRKSPATRARRRGKRRSKTGSTIVVAAPRRVRVRTVKSNPVRRRYRRNPGARGGVMGNLMASVVPAVWGAGGAIATGFISSMVLSKLPLPVALKTGYGKLAVDALLATMLGTFGRRFLGHRATQMASGAMTVLAYQALAPMVAKALPMSQLPGSFEQLPGSSIDQLPAEFDGMGYYSPATTFGDGDEDGTGEYEMVGEHPNMSEYQR